MITQEEQFVSQKIMKSGMAAAASALRQEHNNELTRKEARANLGRSSDRLKAINKSTRSKYQEPEQEKGIIEKLLAMIPWIRR